MNILQGSKSNVLQRSNLIPSPHGLGTRLVFRPVNSSHSIVVYPASTNPYRWPTLCYTYVPLLVVVQHSKVIDGAAIGGVNLKCSKQHLLRFLHILKIEVDECQVGRGSDILRFNGQDTTQPMHKENTTIKASELILNTLYSSFPVAIVTVGIV